MTSPSAALPFEPTLPWTWASGALVPAADASLPASDLGLLRGDGCFETMWVRLGRVEARADHLARLRATCAWMRLPAPPDLDVALDALLGATPDLTQPGAECVLRLTVTAATTLAQLRPLGERGRLRREGVELWTLPEPRHEASLWRHKTLAWTPHAVATRQHPAGASPRFEGLWLDGAGRVLEGTSTNVFAVVGGEVLTCPLAAPVLPGVARARALSRLATLGVPVAERLYDLEALRGASEVFVSAATLPVAPVLALDGAPRAPGPITRALRAALL